MVTMEDAIRSSMPPGAVFAGGREHTHDDTCCGVMAARISDYAAVGIDIESSPPLDADLVHSICSATELEHGAALGEMLSVDFAKLVFYAKESAYKAYFSLARTFLEFSDMGIRFSPRDGTFTGTVLTPAPPMAAFGRTIGGRFLAIGDHLITWAAISQRRA